MNEGKLEIQKGEIAINLDYIIDKRDLILYYIDNALGDMEYDSMCFDNIAVLVEMDEFYIDIKLDAYESALYLDVFMEYELDLGVSVDYINGCISDVIVRDDTYAEFYVDDGDHVVSVTKVVPVEGRNLADISRLVDEMSVDVKKVMHKAHDLGLSLKTK